MRHFQHVIVGTGQASGTLLKKLIPTGDSIAVVEGGKVGGSCVNYGCTPTKTLVASARAMYTARRGDEFGFDVEPVKLDYGRVRERMNGVRNASRKGLVDWMEATENILLLRGWAAFEGDRTLRVGEEHITGDRIYINVGTRAAEPSIRGLSDVPWLDSAGLLELERLPGHLIIVGGGYVGVELGQVFRRFGSDVTILQRPGQIMPHEDEDVAASIEALLEREGVRVLTGSDAVEVRRTESGVRVRVRSHGEFRNLDGSHVMLAAGRRPNSDHLNLKATSIETDERGFIRVDDHCRTTVEGVYALGDVNGRGAFTHTSVNDAEIVLDELYGGPRSLSDRIPIYALFSDPPLGRVGMTEKEAVSSCKNVVRAVKPMSRISRALEMGETYGFAKILVDNDSDRFLGAAIHGANGDEIVGIFAAAIHAGMTRAAFRRMTLIHPTIAEHLPYLLDDLAPVERA